ncbi:hypothetical protein [Sunxiuqinia sp. sy24]|uniref:hypothetical protein n=1 Tax=Sunxiuqinia sp. sy24 TaxID=3461495 RepID=UPI004045E132
MPLRIIFYRRITNYKIFSYFAEWDHCLMRWSFGFIVRLIMNDKEEFEFFFDRFLLNILGALVYYLFWPKK